MMRRGGITVALAALACGALLGCGERGATVPDTPDGTVTAVAEALADGRPEILWAAMPASYQEDVTGLIHEFAEKMDAELYDKGFALAKKLVAVLRDQRDFILASPVAAKSPVDVETAREKWDAVIGGLDALVNSELSSLESLQSIDVGAFLRDTGGKLMQSASEISRATSEDKYNQEFVAKCRGVKAEVVSSEGDAATLKLTAPGEEPEEVQFVRVEGKWVPKEMAEEWSARIAEARAELAQMSKEKIAKAKPQVMMVMGAIEPLLDQLHKAKTQEEFDQVIGQTLGTAMGAIMRAGVTGGAERPPVQMPREPEPAPDKEKAPEADVKEPEEPAAKKE